MEDTFFQRSKFQILEKIGSLSYVFEELKNWDDERSMGKNLFLQSPKSRRLLLNLATLNIPLLEDQNQYSI